MNVNIVKYVVIVVFLRVKKTVVVDILPMIISSPSLARRRIFLQISMVNIVLAELKTDVNDDIRADNIAANIVPRTPEKT